MRSALLESTGHITMTDVGIPSLKTPDEVLIQVKTVGICGSEIHAFEGTHPFRKAPVVMGHEMAGIVAAAGQNVSDFVPGDRVVVDPQWVCGQCSWCQAGDYNLCPTKQVLGTSGWPGAFGEYVVVPRETVFRLPDRLSFVQGATIEPLSVAVHAARRANLGPGKSVVILGTGSIGGLISGVSKALGASSIITADIRQHCLDAARERLGATHDFLLPDKDLVSKINKLTGGQGVDAVIISADDLSLLKSALDIVKRRGTIVLVALLTSGPLEFMAYDVIRKEAHLVGTYMGNTMDVQRAIEWAESGEVDVGAIVTHQLPIEQAQRGMELACTKQDNAIKVVLSFDSKSV